MINNGKGKFFFVTPDGKQHWYGEGFFGYLEGQCTFKIIDLKDEMNNTDYERKETQYHGQGTLTRRTPVIELKMVKMLLLK